MFQKMIRKGISVVFIAVAALAASLVGIAQQAPTEAPAGFDTPTLAGNPGAESVSNGIPEPAGDT